MLSRGGRETHKEEPDRMPYLSTTGSAHPVDLCYIASHLEALRELEHLARLEHFPVVHAEPWPGKVEAGPPLAGSSTPTSTWRARNLGL
jgi:hypothetical protein